LELWIDADYDYASYLSLDLAELSARRAHLEKQMHQHTFSAGEFEHRVKTIMRDMASCKTDLSRLLPKKEALVNQLSIFSLSFILYSSP
jgi:hypothetical protein